MCSKEVLSHASLHYLDFVFVFFLFYCCGLVFVEILPLLLIGFRHGTKYNHGKFLQEIVSKCSTQFSIILLVPNISSLKIAHHSQPRELDEHGIL